MMEWNCAKRLECGSPLPLLREYWLAICEFSIQPEYLIAVAIKRLKKAEEDFRTPNASRILSPVIT